MKISELVPIPMKFQNISDKDFLLSLNSEFFPNKSTCSFTELPELVFMVSGVCNLHCAYCFTDFGTFDRHTDKLMTEESARSAIDVFVNKFGGVQVVKFYGGEPTINLRVIKFICEYFQVLYLQQKIPAMPSFGMVSNLTRVTQELIDLVQRFNFRISASLDGPPEVHDEHRKFVNGRGSYTRVVNNIRKLLSKTNQPDTIECVYSPIHLSKGYTIRDTVRFIRQQVSTKSINIHFVADFQGFYSRIGDNDLVPYVSQFRNMQRDFLRDLTLEYCEGSEFGSPLLNMLLRSLVFGSGDYHCSLGQRTFTVDVDGGVYPCYVLIGHQEYLTGMVADAGLFDKQVFQNVKAVLSGNTKDMQPVCNECDIKAACGACPGDMIEINDDLITPFRISCESQIGMFEGVLQGIQIIRNDSNKYSRILAILQNRQEIGGRQEGCISCSRFNKEYQT